MVRGKCIIVTKKEGIMGRKYGFSFSWKRAVGISSAKARI